MFNPVRLRIGQKPQSSWLQGNSGSNTPSPSTTWTHLLDDSLAKEGTRPRSKVLCALIPEQKEEFLQFNLLEEEEEP